MEIRTLQYFLAVTECETITAAAELLHITQPTLSRQLAQLEDELGVKLFIRGARKLVLTDEGMLLRRRAHEIISLSDKTKKELLEQNNLINGEISIGAGELSATCIFPKLFLSFRKLYPNVSYELYTGNADQIKERLDSGLLDLGLMVQPVNIEKYNFIQLNIPERRVILMRPDNPLAQKESLTPFDLTQYPIMLTKRPIVQNEIRNWFGKYYDKLHIFGEHNMTVNASVLVEAGLCVALTLEGAVDIYDKSRLCTRHLSPDVTNTSVLVWKKNQKFSLATQKFLEHLSQNL